MDFVEFSHVTSDLLAQQWAETGVRFANAGEHALAAKCFEETVQRLGSTLGDSFVHDVPTREATAVYRQFAHSEAQLAAERSQTLGDAPTATPQLLWRWYQKGRAGMPRELTRSEGVRILGQGAVGAFVMAFLVALGKGRGGLSFLADLFGGSVCGAALVIGWHATARDPVEDWLDRLMDLTDPLRTSLPLSELNEIFTRFLFRLLLGFLVGVPYGGWLLGAVVLGLPQPMPAVLAVVGTLVFMGGFSIIAPDPGSPSSPPAKSAQQGR